MPSTVSAVEIAAPAPSSGSAVSWAAIIAGALTASAATLLLMLLGSGLGLTMVSPWTDSATITTIAATTAIWIVIVQWVSSALGGYLAGRLRTKWVGLHTDEVYFRDTAHGFLTWALATLIVAVTVGSVLTSAVSTGVQAASTVASGAAMGAAANASGNIADASTGYFVDTLFRPASPPATAQADQGTAAAEASRILLASAASGEMPAEDRTYLNQLVAARTGLSEADAQARVDAVLTRVEAAKTKAKEVADAARKAGIAASLLGALSLLIGAFIASVAAAFGGRQRDDEETLYLGAR